MTARELQRILDGVSSLTGETRNTEKGLDLTGFGLMPFDCARLGLKEQNRYHRLMGSVAELSVFLTKRTGQGFAPRFSR